MRPGTPGFKGSRLREAREARALSATSLAAMVGVTGSSISHYEAGKVTPSPDVIGRISTVLNLPIMYFMREIPRVERRLFWRSRAATTKQNRIATSRRFGWLCDIVDFVASHIDLPPENLPEFGIGEDPSLVEDADIESLAQEVRRYWGLGDGPISNIVWLMENNGIVVVRSELGDELQDAFSAPSSLGLSRAYVVLNTDKQSAVRSRYDAAHELAHLVLHRRVPDRLVSTPSYHSLMEKQAHRFAGAFLMPSGTFQAEVFHASVDGLLQIKPRWKVSVAAMVMRLRDLGAIDERRVVGLMGTMSRRGWRKKEPLDDRLEIEQPRVLKKCIDMLLDRRIILPSELSYLLSCGQAEAERLLGLPAGYMDEPPSPIKLSFRQD